MNKKILILAILAMNVLSCQKDVLDKVDLTALSSEAVWADINMIGGVINNLYTDIPGWDWRCYDHIGDEARQLYAGRYPNAYNLPGNYGPTVQTPLDNWNYMKIRKVNDALVNLEASELDPLAIKKYTAEVKFLRALEYFLMAKRYGGLPLVTKPLTLDDELLIPRSTSDETFKFIVDEFTEAAKLFAEVGVIQTKDGKACQGSALAFKAKALLYWASPLFNPSNDLSRWTAAADAAKAVMDLGKYSLQSDFLQIFRDANSNEVIFKVNYKYPERTHGRMASFNPISIAVGDAGQGFVLQELVDAFPMLNGKAITDPASGYNDQEPYKDRDPRLWATVVWNGAAFRGTTIWSYKGAKDGVGSQYATITGYYTRKAINEKLTDINYGKGDDTPFIYIRYADILLSYAEALNEASGPSEAIYSILEQIRTRAGLTDPSVPRSHTKASMRDFIRNERYIELALEQERTWDIRRWKIAEQLLDGKKFHGMLPEKLADGTFKYTRISVDDAINIVFKEKQYLQPVPYSEILLNPKLTQNPGWE